MEKVIHVMERLVEFKGKPSTLRVDNGSEFIAKTFRSWCSKQKIDIQYIQPGKPMQNAYIERFNRSFREDVLDAYIFEDLHQVKIIAEDWREDYNQNHPHGSLMGMSPIQFKAKFLGAAPKCWKEENYIYSLSEKGEAYKYREGYIQRKKNLVGPVEDVFQWEALLIFKLNENFLILSEHGGGLNPNVSETIRELVSTFFINKITVHY